MRGHLTPKLLQLAKKGRKRTKRQFILQWGENREMMIFGRMKGETNVKITCNVFLAAH